MRGRSRGVRCGVVAPAVATLLALAPVPAVGAIEEAIEEAEQVRCDPEVEARLEETIERGRRAIETLRSENRSLQVEKAELEERKAELERVQTALASGLIGAVLTALVAIGGVVVKSLGSRIDRDYRRLEVLEKAAALREKGERVPAGIVERYLGRGSESSR